MSEPTMMRSLGTPYLMIPHSIRDEFGITKESKDPELEVDILRGKLQLCFSFDLDEETQKVR